MRRFYAPPQSFAEQTVSLNQEETRHLRDVLRLRAGDEINVFDGEGAEFLCRIERIEKKETELRIINNVAPKSPESDLKLTLAAAIMKGEKFDLVVQKACELGVWRVIPLNTKRTDVKLKNVAETEKKLERWRRIILEASKQCGRAKLMRIEFPITFEELIISPAGVRILFSERGGQSFEDFVKQNKEVKEITAAIGSEGGWEDSEINLAEESGFQIITLGGRILRAETAAIAIPALLQNHFGDFR